MYVALDGLPYYSHSKDSNARTIGSETFDAFFLSRSIKARDVIFGWVSRPLAKLEASDV